MSELLFCPFCGCEDIDEYEGDYGNGVYCMNCGAMMGEPIHMEYHIDERVSIDKAIAAWNSRAERITDDEWESYKHSVPATEENMAKFGWVRERTCEFNIKDNMNESEGMGDVWIECSACHCVFDYYADEWLMNMSYCPNCGARRVAA